MIIGIDIRTLMDAQYSGVSEYTYNLVKTLLKLDSSNEYRLFYNSLSDLSGRMPKFNQPNVKIIKTRYPNKILNYLLFKCFNYPRVKDLFGEIDVLFMPHINFIGINGGHKSILTIHDLSFLRYPEFFSKRKNFWHRMVKVKNLVKKFDKIAAVSENTKNDIIELLGVKPEKIAVICLGIENLYKVMDKNDAGLKRVKEKYSLPEKFILFLGTVEPRKNIEGLIEAYNILREENINLSEFKLIIAGGRGWKSENIYREWQRSKYGEDIKFLGYIPKEEKVYLYNLASLFVYPSFYEGFGFPPLEAMASGLPVITSNASSLPEIVGNAGLMIDPYNSASLAQAMRLVLNDKSLRHGLIRRGQERVKEFNWEKTAEEYLRILKS
jgi:glycosyltransferase involved in cell wall biosynthesis